MTANLASPAVNANLTSTIGSRGRTRAFEGAVGIRCALAECWLDSHRTRDHSRSTTLRRELLIFKPPLYSMNPSFRNLFMKKFTRERVVPTISASVS